MRRAAALLVLLAPVGCPEIDLDAYVYPCAVDEDCPPALACDAVDELCVSAAGARVVLEPRPPSDAYGELLGIAVNRGRVTRWYARGAFTEVDGRIEDPDPGEGAFAHTLGRDVVAVARFGDANPVVFFADGRVAEGPVAAPDRAEVGTFTGALEPGETVVGMAISPVNEVVTWRAGGDVLTGTREVLDKKKQRVTWPIGKHARDADAFAFDEDGTAWVVFRDGSVASGTPTDFRATTTPGAVVGLAISRTGTIADSYLYYANGWVKMMTGSLGDRFVPQDTPWTGDWANPKRYVDGGDWIALPDGRRPDDIIGVAMGEDSPNETYALFDDGTRTFSNGAYDFLGEYLPTIVREEAAKVIDVAMVEGDKLYTYQPELVYLGTGAMPLTTTSSTYDLPGDRTIDEIIGIGGELRQTRPVAPGSIWVLFEDGSITEGRSYDLNGEMQRQDLGYRAITGP